MLRFRVVVIRVFPTVFNHTRDTLLILPSVFGVELRGLIVGRAVGVGLVEKRLK